MGLLDPERENGLDFSHVVVEASRPLGPARGLSCGATGARSFACGLRSALGFAQQRPASMGASAVIVAHNHPRGVPDAERG